MSTEPASTNDPATDTDESPLIQTDGLKKHYQQANGVLDRLVGETGAVQAVDGVDLSVEEGETLAVVGESGCGKSTLGRTLLKLETPTEGRIHYEGEDISGLSDKAMRPYRREMQMIFQDPLAALNPRQTIGEILAAPMKVHDIGSGRAERRERASDLLERVGLDAAHVDRYPHQFSGGQQQRIGIARALSLSPSFIVADEPTSALDVSVQAQVLNLLEELQAELDLALLFITHDLSVVRHIADRVAVMYLGEIVEVAPTKALFDDPQHPYTRSLLSSVPRIDPESRTDRILLGGTVPSPLDPPEGCRFHTRCPMVIPPQGWQADQESFYDAFSYRNSILDGQFDPDSVRDRLRSESKPADDDAVVDALIDSGLPVAIERLPEDAATRIRSATSALVAGERKAANETLRTAFPSPCERQTPETVSRGPDRSAHCHRIDPNAPGDPDPQ